MLHASISDQLVPGAMQAGWMAGDASHAWPAGQHRHMRGRGRRSGLLCGAGPHQRLALPDHQPQHQAGLRGVHESTVTAACITAGGLLMACTPGPACGRWYVHLSARRLHWRHHQRIVGSAARIAEDVQEAVLVLHKVLQALLPGLHTEGRARGLTGI